MSDPILDSEGASWNEAIHLTSPSITSSLMNNYNRLKSWPIVRRSFESPTQLFYLTFKPFNKKYDPNIDYMDQVRKKLGTGHVAVIITREINATKVHYNCMVFTNKPDMVKNFHDKHTARHKIYCKQIKMMDKYKVHHYIIYESQTRYFYATRANWHIQDIYTK